MNKNFVVICLLALSAIQSVAKNYYAAPLAKGTGASYEEPGDFETLVAKIVVGDTLFLKGGVYYYDKTLTISKNGNPEQNVCIFACPGERPIFDFRNEAYGERGIKTSTTTTYLHIKGLTLRYAGKNALLNQGAYCTFENLDVYGNGDTGIQMKGEGGHNLILNCDSHDNFDYQLGGTTAADFGGNADGFADKQYTAPGNTYRGCRAWNNSDDGWDFFQRVTSDGVETVFEDCICFNNGPAEYDMRNHPRYNTDKAWFDMFSGGLTITDADRKMINNVTLEHYVNLGNGNGFKLGGHYTNHDVVLYNCLSVGNAVKGFDQNSNFGKMTIYNCTGYLNNSNYGFYNADGGTLILKNCVSLLPKVGNTLSCKSVTDVNNSWNTSGVECTVADFVSLDTTVITKPRQADGSLVVTSLLRLVEGSDLIDAGLNLGRPFSGKSPDLGCYEYGTDIKLPSVLTLTEGVLVQNVAYGEAIVPVKLTWGGSAETARVDNLPVGLKVEIDSKSKMVTISGTPKTPGVYTMTVKALGESDDYVVDVTIYAKVENARKIAYVTTPDNEADKLMLNALNANIDYDVRVVDASLSSNDYSSYELIVISPVPNSGASAFVGLKGIDKPVLLLKSFALKNTVWDWGTAANTTDVAMKVSEPDHYIFKGLDMIDGNVKVFSSCSKSAVTSITEWKEATGVVALASPASSTGVSIAELSNATVNGVKLTKPFLMIALSEYSTSQLTSDGLLLIINACEYLMSSEEASAIGLEEESKSMILFDGKSVRIDVGVDKMVLYDITGHVVRVVRESEMSLVGVNAGLYVVCAEVNGSKVSKMVLVR